MDFIGIPSSSTEMIWPLVLPLIVEACKSCNGRYMAVDIKKLIINRDCQLWVATEDSKIYAVCVTEMVAYPRKKYARVMILTGTRREDWQQDYKDTIEAWAKAQGCDGVESLARRGWGRVFKDYQHTHDLLEFQF